MYKNTAYIALGSNKGDKLGYFRKAAELINNDDNCSVVAASSVYETLPYGVKEQDNFLNAAIEVKTDYELHKLISFLKNIEDKLGRIRTTRWGPREIDLDLLFYNDLIYSDERVTVPHKEVTKRDFVLVPLCEIAGNLIHPVLNQKIYDICITDPEKNIIRKIPEHLL